MYLGLPALMSAPKERALLYTASVVGIAIVIGILLGLLQSAHAVVLAARVAPEPISRDGCVGAPDQSAGEFAPCAHDRADNAGIDARFATFEALTGADG